MPHSPALLRDLVATTATDLGPDAPTLCPPWTVRDLLAHLVVRESRPDALPGVGLPVAALQRHTEQVQRGVAARPFAALVQQVRSGPAAWWPTRLPPLDRAVNVAELAIHHEDLVRAQPGWQPTVLPEEVQRQLWSTVRSAGRMLYRGAPCGVVAVAPGYGRAALRRPPAGRGTVVLTGPPLELLLHAFGRDRVARVEVSGGDAELAELARHRRSA
ncbi:TIGR03085 family metal-binding protein [Serinicoccus kebangsaanensis]|uniref:TIGR03085 family metal-binding protein n=1 Tax=Serinicoccus kebangsaanensis TaxID=2602069 RepID=UPI00124CE536|nr:TIGR03085 family metal-binding protein [Serinicoccus kebangsaanensis]